MAQLKGTSGLLELDPQVEPRASDVQVPVVSVVLGRSENRGNLWLCRRCHRRRRPRIATAPVPTACVFATP